MEDYDKIEKYTRGQLTPDEHNAFNEELNTNKKLAEELAEYRKNQLVLKSAARQQLRASTGSAYAILNTQKNRRILLIRRIAIAASFTLLLAVGFWWLSNGTKKNSPEQLFAQYFEMPSPPSVRDGNVQTNTKWKEAINFYAKQEFQLAIPLFQELLLDNSFEQKETAKLLLGAALLSENKPNEALEIINKINRESSFKEDAEWYQALALLKAKKIEEAKKALEKIADQKRHFKKEEAARLLKVW